MLGRKKDEPVTVLLTPEPASSAEIGEHEAMAALHRARRLKRSATKAVTRSLELDREADEALEVASKEVRRASERR